MSEVATLDPKALMHSIIQRVATGPELSKSISREEARRGVHAVLDQEVDPVQAGIFLIALRMKRETDEEVIGVQQALMDVTESVTAPIDEVLTLSDPFRRLQPDLACGAILARGVGGLRISHDQHWHGKHRPEIRHHLSAGLQGPGPARGPDAGPGRRPVERARLGLL